MLYSGVAWVYYDVYSTLSLVINLKLFLSASQKPINSFSYLQGSKCKKVCSRITAITFSYQHDMMEVHDAGVTYSSSQWSSMVTLDLLSPASPTWISDWYLWWWSPATRIVRRDKLRPAPCPGNEAAPDDWHCTLWLDDGICVPSRCLKSFNF